MAVAKALQLVKGGFSYRAKRELGFVGEIWQTSFYDHRVRAWEEYERLMNYIHQNPVRRGLTSSPEQFSYSSASGRFRLDELPQRLKPEFSASLKPQG